MKLLAWYSQATDVALGSKREIRLSNALVEGARARGWEAETRTKQPQIVVEPCDLACFIGVKNREYFWAYRNAGINCAYFDKGYLRARAKDEWLDYWRVAVNAHQPVTFVAKAKRTLERANKAHMELKPWRERGEAIVLDGSSAKHYSFHDIGDPTEVAKRLVQSLRKFDRPIIYRPKPSWTGAVPIEGTEYSNGKDYWTPFARAHVLVTYGSNYCFDAVLAGVPSIVLGEGIAGPISSKSLEDVDRPRLASDQERKQWLANVAWCQFKLDEYRSGMAFDTIEEMIACATNG